MAIYIAAPKLMHSAGARLSLPNEESKEGGTQWGSQALVFIAVTDVHEL